MIYDGPADKFTNMDAAIHILGSAAIKIRDKQGIEWMTVACLAALGEKCIAELNPIERMFLWWTREGTEKYDPICHDEAKAELWPFLKQNRHLIPSRLMDAFVLKHGTKH